MLVEIRHRERGGTYRGRKEKGKITVKISDDIIRKHTVSDLLE